MFVLGCFFFKILALPTYISYCLSLRAIKPFHRLHVMTQLLMCWVIHMETGAVELKSSATTQLQIQLETMQCDLHTEQMSAQRRTPMFLCYLVFSSCRERERKKVVCRQTVQVSKSVMSQFSGESCLFCSLKLYASQSRRSFNEYQGIQPISISNECVRDATLMTLASSCSVC